MNRKYYTDPFCTELHTKVTRTWPRDGKYHVVLEDTIFYPTGGGQPHDLGTIAGIPVLDVFEDGGQVVHVIDQPLEEDSVELQLDWTRRFFHMQHHTGQHLLSAYFSNEYGWETRGFHLGENYTTIDITTPELDPDTTIQVERAVNQLIYRDLTIKDYLVTLEEAAQLRLRKLPTVDEDIRIVEIDNFDYSPCGGTHLRSTGQIGVLKIIKTEKYKGMTRVYFLCGWAALADYQEKHSIVQDLGNELSVGSSEIIERVKGESAARRELEDKLKDVQNRLWEYQARELVSQTEDTVIFHNVQSESMEEAQALARHITAQGRFFAAIQAGNRLILAQSLGTEPHCGNLVKQHAVPLGGRGGGSPQLAQVFFQESSNLEQFCDFLQDLSHEFTK